MKIGEVSKQTNLSEDTLRFYEKNHLIGEVLRANGVREYSEQNLRRIEFVKCLRGAEVPIKVIQKYVELVDGGEETLPERIELLEKQRAVLGQKLAEIQAAYDKIVYKINLYAKESQ